MLSAPYLGAAVGKEMAARRGRIAVGATRSTTRPDGCSRLRGYATCRGEDLPYSNGVSAAALDPEGRPVVVVNVWGIEQRVPVKRFPALGEAARATADSIAALLYGDR